MAQSVRFRLDDDACAQLDALRARVRTAGLAAAAGRPSVTVAAAAQVPPAARAALADELRVLTLPSLWLATLGAAAGRPDELVLAAVVDTELLAVHAAVHDALAGRGRWPVADHLPSSRLPHCVLATADPAAAFAILHPLVAVRARVVGVEVSAA
ncbi:MAG: 2'-5' RNA ligase family protein [Pseudonocardia sp.]